MNEKQERKNESEESICQPTLLRGVDATRSLSLFSRLFSVLCLLSLSLYF